MSEWQPIETAPWGEVVLVKNDIMQEPVRATRGYSVDGVVLEDQTFFTTYFTPHKHFPTPSGNLVCPNVWMPLSESPEAPKS